MTPKICQPCLRFSSLIRKLLSFIGFRKSACCEAHQHISSSTARALDFSKIAADCGCERFRVSRYSPHPVGDSEVITRFAFSPLHTNNKGRLKPNLFDRFNSTGCSIQRESIASDTEILNFLKSFFNKTKNQSWIGVAQATCGAVRKITLMNQSDRYLCVLDTAERHNPAHGEVFQSHQYEIEDADRIELRKKLWEAFGSGALIQPSAYRETRILPALAEK